LLTAGYLIAKCRLSACKARVNLFVFLCRGHPAQHLCIIKQTTNKTNKMKTFFFTILATIFFGVAAQAQTKSAALSLDNAIEVNFGKGTAVSAKTANNYTQIIKANNNKTFNVATEASFAAPYLTNIPVPASKILDQVIKSNTPCYFGNTFSISVF
jgi:hypothetical protein